MTATTGYLVRSSHPEDDAEGRVFAPGDTVPDLDAEHPYNKEKIQAGVFYPLQGDGEQEEGSTSSDEGSVGINATEAAVRLADENDIDLSTITGSGAGERIIEPDVSAAIEAKDGDSSGDDKEGDD